MLTRPLIAAGLLLAPALMTTPARPANAPTYDGVWSVEGTTDVGPCDKSFHGKIRIRGADIVEAPDTATQAVGSIDAHGDVWARLSRSDGQARASGRLHGATASGAWSSNTAYCGGRWTARKIG